MLLRKTNINCGANSSIAGVGAPLEISRKFQQFYVSFEFGLYSGKELEII